MAGKSIVFLRSNPVDPDSRVEKEVNSLVKAGYTVRVVAWDRNERYKVKESFLELEDGQAKIYRFGIPASFGGGIKSNLKPLITFQIRLLKWLLKNRKSYDIIHACDFDTAYTASHCARLFKKKLIYDIFDYYVAAFGVPGRLKTLLERKDHQIINSADAVIICTEKRKEQIKGTAPKQLTIIHNTPPVYYSGEKTMALHQDKIKIVYVGILDQGRFLKELTSIIINKSECELHIGGFGPFEDYFKERAAEHSNIIFYGKLPYQKTLELESCCDIMTAIYDPQNPNHKYVAPNKFYEALMLGKPLVVAKDTGIDDIILSENIGEVIVFNEKSFEEALTRLIKCKNEWSGVSQKARKIYYELYAWQKMEKRLLELYEGI